MPSLLLATDPAVVSSYCLNSDSPFFLIADHAGRAIPQQLGQLGLSDAELSRHIAWDIGIAGVAQQLSTLLQATLVQQHYSRLVIDCNRPLIAADSITTLSEHTTITGNMGLSEQQCQQRRDEIFWPYHHTIRELLALRQQQQQRTVLVSLHSFTPCYKGVNRVWQGGVLANRDRRFSAPLLHLLRQEGLVIGDNQPYALNDASDYSVPVYGEQGRLLHVELEIRQDLITDAEGQQQWAQRLARLLPQALAMVDQGA